MTHAAPEQVLGKRCTLAADVYSLGILLIELTTQRAVLKRSDWRLPLPPGECSQVSGRHGQLPYHTVLVRGSFEPAT